MNLIIVESPTKAKTLTNFLGKDYQVVSTMGHIRDLPEKKFGIRIEQTTNNKQQRYNFIPEYVLVTKKEEVVEKLKKEAAKAQKIFLATDPDREGEAIAWHTEEILRGQGERREQRGLREQREKKSLHTPYSPYPPHSLSRIVFHEITKSAIEKALTHPGEINLQLVNAQQARRVLDRLVGYKLSPLLWRKIRSGLSAGRVQSVAVRLIVEREREIEKFIPEEYWEILTELKRHLGGLKEGTPTFLAKLAKVNGKVVKIENETQAKEVVSELQSQF